MEKKKEDIYGKVAGQKLLLRKRHLKEKKSGLMRQTFSALHLTIIRHCQSTGEYHRCTEAWRWQHHTVQCFSEAG